MQSDHDGSMQYGRIMKKEIAKRRLEAIEAAGGSLDDREARALKFSI